MRSFFYAFFLLLLIACTSEDSNSQQEIDLKKMTDLGSEILELVEASNCSNGGECSYIGYGSKPCGGPWGYLVYSNSIDVDLLISKVEEYNQLERDYNEKYEIYSDCMHVSPPVDLICDNGKCIGIYNQTN